MQVVFLLLLAVVVVFALVAQWIRVPYPIVLVVAGLAISLVPGIPAVDLDPQLIFHVVLPLLLNWAAWHTSWLSLRRNAWSVFVLAVGLVVFTVFGVALAAPLLPGFDWRTGFLLGAVIAPTDAIAATSIARRLRLPKRLVDILEGESLVNDASGLLLFQMGVAVIVAGHTPTVAEGAGRFAFMSIAGTAIGLAIGFLIERIERIVSDPPIVIAITLLVPYAAYFAAEEVHASGVLAVVASALYHSRRSDEHRPARVRLETEVVWNALAFIVNGLVFVLIGLQLRSVLRGLGGTSLGMLLLYVLGFSLLVIALRLLWVFPALSVGALFHRTEPLPPRSMFLIGWASMRGVIALAAAMSLPETVPNRAMIIFLTFGAIFFSLVLKGVTLPPLIRALGLAGVEGPEVEETEARRIALVAALAHLDELRDAGRVLDEHYDDLREHYTLRLAAIDDESVDHHGSATEHALQYRRTSHALLQSERAALVRLRNEHHIPDEVMRELLAEIDLAETRLDLELQKLTGE